MPFNYDAQLNYMPISSDVLKQASVSPFEIAGREMSKLSDAIDNRAFEKQLGATKDLQGLSLLTPTTDKQRALLSSKLGMFNALNQQEMAQRTFDLQAANAQLAQENADRTFDFNAGKLAYDYDKFLEQKDFDISKINLER